jgi:hypothetical protein
VDSQAAFYRVKFEMMMDASILPQNVLYYGTDAPLPAQIALRAGPLSLIYESGDLRYIRLGRREILRRVYVALRDRNWGTVPPVLSNVQIEQTDDAFQMSYDVEHRQGEIDFFWRGSITGDARGTMSFAMDGVARSSFLRNRIGFCVLHPIHECAGAACRVEHVDGTQSRDHALSALYRAASACGWMFQRRDFSTRRSGDAERMRCIRIFAAPRGHPAPLR